MCKMTKDSTDLVEDLLAFLNEAWTPFHATAEARRRLLVASFKELDESQAVFDLKVSTRSAVYKNMDAHARVPC